MQPVWTSLSGMQASQAWLKNLSNNVANEATAGYAAETTSFADEYTRALSGAATGPTSTGRYTPPGYWGGSGTFVNGSESNFDGMSLNATGNPMDIAIQGNGFFMVQGQNGQTLLTKAGNFQWAQTGTNTFVLSTAEGQPVLDVNGKPIVKQGTGNLAVAQDGQITIGNQPTQKLAMAEVTLPSENLTPVGDTLFQANPGVPVRVVNQTGAAPNSTFVQGSLTSSNVDLTQTLTDIVQAQMMYELNAQAESINNKMMQTANNVGVPGVG